VCDQIHKSLDEWIAAQDSLVGFSSEQACAGLEELNHKAVQIARRLLEKRKPVNINRVGRKFKHGWSPQHMLQVYQLNFLLALLPKRRVVYLSTTLQQYCKQDILDKAISTYELAA
jgi:hypothetical protein